MAGNKQIPFPSSKVRWKDFKKVFTLNIGTILFGCLFIYMLFSIILYFTSVHFTSYQVVAGPLSKNETYTGLALYHEQVITADTGGYLNYYTREGVKINASAIVYSLGEQQMQAPAQALTEEDLALLREQMNSFSYGFQPKNFNSTYNFKYELGGSILQYSVNNQNQSQTGQGAEQASAFTMGGQTLIRTRGEGIILYSRDGYENTTADNFTEADFDQMSYHKEGLKTKEPVQAGDPVYRLITGETWNLVIPLSDRQASALADKTAIKVRFLKDNISQNGDFSIIQRDGKKYGNIEFSSGLIRYAGERFLDIELVTNVQSGLKIPLTSIVNKDFYMIPIEYKKVESDSDEAGFLIEGSGKKRGKANSKFVSTVIYSQDEHYCYVDTSAFDKGSILLNPDSNDRYVVEDTAALEGAYCINKGYPVFRFINIMEQNEEFCIIEKDTEYGLSQYDHIILDASQVREENS